MGKKRFKEKKYLEGRGNICPYCLSNNINADNPLGADSDIAWQYVICNQCGSEWRDSYKLIGAEGVNNNTHKYT